MASLEMKDMVSKGDYTIIWWNEVVLVGERVTGLLLESQMRGRRSNKAFKYR